MAKLDSDIRKLKTMCSYWNADKKECLVSKEGLYLPVRTHIDSYCLTGNHVSCPKYQECHQDEFNICRPSTDNRRQHQRMVRRFSFRVSEFFSDTDSPELIDDTAVTVDVSLGGIRFQSHEPVNVDSLVLFSLNGNEINPSLEGVGKVKWCRTHDEGRYFHAGISFADKKFSQILGSKMELVET